MATLNSIITSTCFQIMLKLILGTLLTGIIGLERSSLNKPAGFGTHALLGISAVLIVLISEHLSYKFDIDMSRIPAQFISGIGFIGAGTILQDGFNVKGVTTAAGLLSATCIGLAVGGGYYTGAIFATIITYLILVYSHSLSDKFDRFAKLSLKIKTVGDVDEVIKQIENYLSKIGYYEAYHMNKKKWISIILDDTLKDEEIISLLDKSYDIVSKLDK